MHATLDHLGMGLISGTGPGVKLTPSTNPGSRGNITVEGSSTVPLKTDSDKAELENQCSTRPPAPAASFPSIARDGRKAYASKLSAGQEGIVYDLHSFDLTQPHARAHSAQRARRLPRRLASGEYLAWVDRTDAGQNRLAVAKVADLNTVLFQVTAPQDRRIVHPVWRGDSLALAFSSDWQPPPNIERDNFDIYAVKLEQLTASAQELPRSTP